MVSTDNPDLSILSVPLGFSLIKVQKRYNAIYRYNEPPHVTNFRYVKANFHSLEGKFFA